MSIVADAAREFGYTYAYIRDGIPLRVLIYMLRAPAVRAGKMPGAGDLEALDAIKRTYYPD